MGCLGNGGGESDTDGLRITLGKTLQDNSISVTIKVFILDALGAKEELTDSAKGS